MESASAAQPAPTIATYMGSGSAERLVVQGPQHDAASTQMLPETIRSAEQPATASESSSDPIRVPAAAVPSNTSPVHTAPAAPIGGGYYTSRKRALPLPFNHGKDKKKVKVVDVVEKVKVVVVPDSPWICDLCGEINSMDVEFCVDCLRDRACSGYSNNCMMSGCERRRRTRRFSQ